MAARKIVVVGNGMVGHHYVEQLIASGQKVARPVENPREATRKSFYHLSASTCRGSP